MNKNHVLGTLGLIVLLALGTYSWSRHANVEANHSIIPIGGIFILTGQGASWGEASRNGMELAIQDINAAGGVNGKLLKGIYEDDGSDPQKAISAVHKLTESDGARFIIGTNWSNTGVPVAPVAAAAHVVMISPSLGLKDFNESSPYLFNVWQHDDVLSAKLADIVYAKGYRKVALFGANDVWVKAQTAAFVARFEQLGGTVAFTYEPTTDATDERTAVKKALSVQGVDAIVMTTDGTALTPLTARQLHELGSTLPMFNITVDKQILADCGTNCDGMLFPTSLTPTLAFETKYGAAYGGRKVEIGADSSYDAVMMIAEAMKATHSEDPDQVKAYLAAIKVYHGASGTLTSDGKRGFTKDYVLMKSENGAPVATQ
jgi:branched-chain amino acid transport system substrate-binding protein